MMISTVNKKQASIFLFSLYFLVYTISPLTFTVSDKQSHEQQYLEGTATSTVKSLHVLLWDFVLKGFSSHETSSHSPVNTSVLIKKKRAVVPEVTSTKLLPIENASLATSFDDPLAPAAYGPNITHSDFQGIHKGFNPVYAGHSPPFTS